MTAAIRRPRIVATEESAIVVAWPIVEVCGLRKSYGQTVAIDNVAFSALGSIWR